MAFGRRPGALSVLLLSSSLWATILDHPRAGDASRRSAVRACDVPSVSRYAALVLIEHRQSIGSQRLASMPTPVRGLSPLEQPLRVLAEQRPERVARRAPCRTAAAADRPTPSISAASRDQWRRRRSGRRRRCARRPRDRDDRERGEGGGGQAGGEAAAFRRPTSISAAAATPSASVDAPISVVSTPQTMNSTPRRRRATGQSNGGADEAELGRERASGSETF